MASNSSSESSGYYRYRCRNFYTHNCGNWVWLNNSACAECVAAGREQESSDEREHSSTIMSWTDGAGSEDDDRPCPSYPTPGSRMASELFRDDDDIGASEL